VLFVDRVWRVEIWLAQRTLNTCNLAFNQVESYLLYENHCANISIMGYTIRVGGLLILLWITGCSPKTPKMLVNEEIKPINKEIKPVDKEIKAADMREYPNAIVINDTFEIEEELALEETYIPIWLLWSAVQQYPDVKEFTVIWNMGTPNTKGQFKLIYRRPISTLVYTVYLTRAGISRWRTKSVYKNVSASAFEKTLGSHWEVTLKKLEAFGAKRIQHFKRRQSLRTKED
jgi:hypothetical protein